MMKHLKAIKSTMIIGLMLVSIFTAFNVVNPNLNTAKALDPLITFPSVLSVDVDIQALPDTLEIDRVYSVPVNITYSTGIPAGFKLGGMINNLFLFGSMIVVPPYLRLSVIEENTTVKDWALVFFASPTIQVPDIPFQGDNPVVVEANLIISPRYEAPAEPQKIAIKVSVDGLGKLQPVSIDSSVPFTPSYIPEIDVFVDKPTRNAGPREVINFDVKVVNKANKVTKVKAELVSVDPKWAPIVNPTEIEIKPSSDETITFSVVAPYDFGWHDEQASMEVKFTPYPSPIPENYDATLGQSQSVFLRVNNYGFSLSGFEFVLILIIIIIIVVVFILYKKKK